MLHFLKVAAFIMMLTTSALAQSIRGTVRDAENKQVLAGATVQLAGTRRASIVDESGQFLLTNLPAGSHVLLAKFLGYAPQQQTVEVTTESVVDIFLSPTFQLTDEVVVFATRANEKTPTAYANVDKQTLQKQNFGQDMPMLLNWTPSIVTTSDAGTGIGYTGLRIRGSDATRINVTINGIPYNDSESQGTFWVDIPDIASSTQSVQVQRGVGTSTNGAGAFGGSVNLQTNSLQSDAYAEVILAGGSFNTQRYTMKTGTGLIQDRWAFDAKASKITSDGFVDRASSDLASYYLSGGYYGKNTVVKAIAFGGKEKTYQSWNGIDGETMKANRTFNSAGALYDENWNVIGYYDNEVDDYQQDHYQLHLSQQLGKNWNANLSAHYTYGRGFYEQYKQDKDFADLGLPNLVLKDTTLTYGDFIVRKWLDNKFYGATFSVNYDQEKTVLTLGGAFNQYGNAKHFGEIVWGEYGASSQIRQHYYDGESVKNDFNFYTKINYDITSSLSGFMDVQYRAISYTTSGIDSDRNPYTVDEAFNFFNPKLGLSYSLSASDILYSSFAIANREPSRADYLDSPIKPRPEQLHDLEVGWRRSRGGNKVEVNYYLMNYKDQLVLTGKLDNVGNPVRANVGKSFRTGLEISAAIRLHEYWTWVGNVAFSRNVNRDFVPDEDAPTVTKNTAIAFSPNVIGGSQLVWSGIKNFQTALLSKYVGNQYLNNTEAETLQLDSYFINDVRLSYLFQPKGIQAFEVSILVNNILNVEYSSNGATYGDGVAYYYPQAGTNVLAMITLRF